MKLHEIKEHKDPDEVIKEIPGVSEVDFDLSKWTANLRFKYNDSYFIGTLQVVDIEGKRKIRELSGFLYPNRKERDEGYRTENQHRVNHVSNAKNLEAKLKDAYGFIERDRESVKKIRGELFGED